MIYEAGVRQLMLVEDNPGDAELISDLMEKPGGMCFEIDHYVRLHEALLALNTKDFDVVLLDLRLPDGQGSACVRAILGQVPDIPIVVLTGMDDEELALECISDGAQDYLVKHELTGANLRRAVGYALARSAERAERIRADVLEHHLAAIVESSSDAIISCDLHGRLTSWNPGAESIFKYSAAEALGQSFSSLIFADQDLGSQSGDDFERRVKGEPALVEINARRKDEVSIVLSMVWFGLRDSHGKLIAEAAILRDVTEQKARNDELKRRNEELLLRDAQMRALTTRLTSIREAERTRISREVHDELGQLLTALKIDLAGIRRKVMGLDGTHDAILNRLREAEDLVLRTIASVQRIAIELRPSVLDAIGLSAAIRDEVRRFEKRTGMNTALSIDVARDPPSDVSTALFRILQELLTNIVRHARASSARIDLCQSNNHWTLSVEDDGRGIESGAISKPQSLGLLGIQERAESLGGTARFVQQ